MRLSVPESKFDLRILGRVFFAVHQGVDELSHGSECIAFINMEK